MLSCPFAFFRFFSFVGSDKSSSQKKKAESNSVEQEARDAGKEKNEKVREDGEGLLRLF